MVYQLWLIDYQICFYDTVVIYMLIKNENNEAISEEVKKKSKCNYGRDFIVSLCVMKRST